MSLERVGEVDVAREPAEHRRRLVAVEQHQAAEVLAELALHADLQQVVLEQHAARLADEPANRRRRITPPASFVEKSPSANGGRKITRRKSPSKNHRGKITDEKSPLGNRRWKITKQNYR